MFTGGYYTGFSPYPCGGGAACAGGAGVGWPARFDSVAKAALTTLTNGDGSQLPMYVQPFESARYTPGQGPTYSVYPYTPSLISVSTPAMWAAPPPTAGADLAASAAAQNISVAAPAGLNVNNCGYKCTGPSASPLPPSGFQAWREMIYRANAGNAALWRGGDGATF